MPDVSGEELKRQLGAFLSDCADVTRYPPIKDALEFRYEYPEFDILRKEICRCLLLALDHAAITLTNHFLEALLKFGLIYGEAIKTARERMGSEPTEKLSYGHLSRYLKKPVERFSGMDLSDTIDAACRRGLITKPQKKELTDYRTTLRNPWSHADHVKMFAGRSIPGAVLRFSEDGVECGEMEEVPMEAIPFAWGDLKQQMAQQNSVPYFLRVHEIGRHIERQLLQ